MPAITGRNMLISKAGTSIPQAGSFSIQHTMELPETVNTASAGGTALSEGNTDWSGTYTADGPIPAVKPGESFEFRGATSGSGATAKGCKGTARCSQVVINVNMESGEPITHTVTFGANGTLTIGTVDVPLDTTIVTPWSSKPAKAELLSVDGTGAADLAECRSATITMSSGDPTYVSTSIPGQTQRAQGNFSASVACTVYVSELSALPAAGAWKILRVYVNATDYWEFKFVVIAGFSNVEVNRRTAAMVGANIEFKWSAAADVSGTQTAGEITAPDDAIWFEFP